MNSSQVKAKEKRSKQVKAEAKSNECTERQSQVKRIKTSFDF